MSSQPSSLVERQAERLPKALRRAEEKLRTVQRDAAASRLLESAKRGRSVMQRVMWLQHAASAWARPMARVAACRKGCSHCCTIPVTISRTEAERIATVSGRALAADVSSVRPGDLDTAKALREAQERLREGWTGVACPFLRDGACSIYDVRPFACRTLLNLDDDALLCEVVPGATSAVPYADDSMMKGDYMLAQPAAEMADIRAFFPPLTPR